MHVHTLTPLPVDEVMHRFCKANNQTDDARRMSFVMQRTPPKIFLGEALLAPRPAAEIAVRSQKQGAEVVLRLMWGPLPAPFPRALAAAGIMLALLILVAFQTTAIAVAAASMFVLLPMIALAYQRQGEYELQARLSAMLDGATFSPARH